MIYAIELVEYHWESEISTYSTSESARCFIVIPGRNETG